MEEFKQIKCKVFRADDAEDTADIYVCIGDKDFTIKCGEEVSLPKPHFDVLSQATYPVTVKEEIDGQLRTHVVNRPRFSITLLGIETSGEANERVANLAMKNAKENDELRKENEALRAMLEEQKKDRATK